MKTKPPAIRFRELERQVLYHELRVFIAGVEVTQDLTDTVSVSMQNRAMYTTAQITLDNAGDKYVMTAANVAGTFGVDPFARYDESPKRDIVNRKLGYNARETIADRETVVTELFQKARAAASIQFDSASTPADDTAKRAVVARIVNDTMQGLGPGFFRDDQTATETGKSVLREVINAFPSLKWSDATDTVKRGVSARNSPLAQEDVTVQSFRAARREANPHNPRDPDTGMTVWTFDQGDIVVNKHDPIVIFAHNPLTENDEWYRAFKGFINTVTETCDEVTGHSVIQISCYCIRQMMAHMRVAKNMAIAQIKPIFLFEEPGNSYFNDLTSANTDGTSSFASDMALEDIVAKIVTGVPSGLNETPAAVVGSSASTPDKGVGGFTLGTVLEYPPAGSTKVTSGTPHSASGDKAARLLEQWHNIVMFGARSDGVGKKRELHGWFLTYDEVTKAGQACRAGEAEDPWSGRLHMLLPAGGTDVKNLESFAFDTNHDEFQFADRLAFLKSYVEKLDYQFYTTPCGDLVLEFPMYDFAPEHFGAEWSKVFTVGGHVISSQVTPEAEEIPAAVVVTGQATPYQAANNEEYNAFTLRVSAFSKVVATRYGIGDIPMLSQPWLDTKEKVAAYALLQYQKMLMGASRASFTAAYRPFWGVNRPVLLARRGRLGITESVETTWELFGQVTSSVSITAIRKALDEPIPGGDGKPDRLIRTYRFVTGGQYMGLSYLTPFNQKKNPDAKAKPDSTSKAQTGAAAVTTSQSGGTTVTTGSTSNTEANQSLPTDAASTPATLDELDNDLGAEREAAGSSLPAEASSPTMDVKAIKKQCGIDLTGGGIESVSNRPPAQDMSNAPKNIDTQGHALRVDDLTRDILFQMALAMPPGSPNLVVTQSWADKNDAHVRGRQVKDSKHFTGQAFDLKSKRNGVPLYTPAQIDAMANAATSGGYDFIEETQASGPHFHVQKSSGETGKRSVEFNQRADQANRQSSQ